MTYLLELEIPSLPKTINAISHTSFWARKSENKRWVKLISQYALGKGPIEPLKKAEVVLTRVSSMEPDTDGLYASFKSVLDALVSQNIIEDDKPSVINLICQWEKGKRNEGKIKIKVTGE